MLKPSYSMATSMSSGPRPAEAHSFFPIAVPPSHMFSESVKPPRVGHVVCAWPVM